MEITRNQYYLAGLVLLFLGIQFRMVDTIELKPEVAKFLAERTNSYPVDPVSANIASQVPTATLISPQMRTKTLPDWLGWLLVSVGSVLVLHSWAMPRPSG